MRYSLFLLVMIGACGPAAANTIVPPSQPGVNPCGTGILNANCTLNATAFNAAIAVAPVVTSMGASIPTPLATVPLGAMPAGIIGTATTYVPGNAVQPSLIRATTVTTASDGTFSVSWSTALGNSNPTVNTIPINPGTQPVICNVISRSASAVSGKCWALQTAALSLAIVTAGLTVNPSGGNAGNMSVMVVAREPTQ